MKLDSSTLRSRLDDDVIDGVATPREILFSVFIVGIIVSFGCCIHGCIRDSITDHNLKIEQAIRISDDEHFKHCLETSPGDAFCEGDLDAVDAVSDDKGNIEGDFWSISRIYQEYRKHVYYTESVDDKGKKHRKRHEYWSWDSVGFPYRKKCSTIMFCGVKFKVDKIYLGDFGDVQHISLGHHKRYEYVTVKKHHHGSIFTTFNDKTISEESPFRPNCKPDEMAESMMTGMWPLYLFWVAVVVVIACAVFCFCMLNNKWLETKGKDKRGIRIGGIA